MTFNKNQDYWACVHATELFICIETMSGLGLVGTDPLFSSHLLSPAADARLLGVAALQALKNSRTLNDEDERIAFFDLETGKKQYQNWIATLMSQYGYKTKKSLFKDMKNCSIHCANDLITISPSRHDKLEAWSETGINESDHVLLPVGSAPEEIGAGLKLALSRCI